MLFYNSVQEQKGIPYPECVLIVNVFRKFILKKEAFKYFIDFKIVLWF